MSGNYVPPHLRNKTNADKSSGNSMRRSESSGKPAESGQTATPASKPWRSRTLQDQEKKTESENVAPRGNIVAWNASAPVGRPSSGNSAPGFRRSIPTARTSSSPGDAFPSNQEALPLRQIPVSMRKSASSYGTSDKGSPMPVRSIPNADSATTADMGPRRIISATSRPTEERRGLVKPTVPSATVRDVPVPSAPSSAPSDWGNTGQSVKKLEPVIFGPPVVDVSVPKFATSFAQLAKEAEPPAETAGPNAVDATQLFEAKAAAFKREQMTANQSDTDIGDELLQTQKITSVSIDASVVMKIIKHGSDHHPSSATGQLLGVDVSSKLEISSCFPFTPKVSPDNSQNDDSSSKKDGDDTSMQMQWLHCMDKLNMHSNVAGFYQSFPLGDFFQTTFLDTLYNYQKTFPWSVALVYDSTRTCQGSLCLKAFQISDEFMTLYPQKKFNIKQMQQSKVLPSRILRQIPVTIQNSTLASCFARQLHTSFVKPDLSTINRPSATFSSRISACNPLTPNLNNLELHSETFLEHQLDYLAECVDDFDSDNRKYQKWYQNVQKEQSKLALAVQKRKHDNSVRVNRGEKPLWSGEQLEINSSNLQKLYSHEPSRLDSLLTINQINTYCNQINQFSGPNLTKLYLTKAIQH